MAVDLFEELCQAVLLSFELKVQSSAITVEAAQAGHEPNTITFSATVSACEKVRFETR